MSPRSRTPRAEAAAVPRGAACLVAAALAMTGCMSARPTWDPFADERPRSPEGQATRETPEGQASRRPPPDSEAPRAPDRKTADRKAEVTPASATSESSWSRLFDPFPRPRPVPLPRTDQADGSEPGLPVGFQEPREF